ncbi:MAG: hypothetical protein GX285_03825 [Clostridiales bacterium]|nr:hypothetical protein [Clostridiales bacterium]
MVSIFFRKATVNAVILLIALVMMIFGAVLLIQSGVKSRDDIRVYNKAVETYDQGDYIAGMDKNSSTMTTSLLLQVIDNFSQAAEMSTDYKLKSLAYYNMGTAIVRDYLFFSEERIEDYGLSEAIIFFKEAVKLDSDNEDAKYNLEYCERYNE